MVIGRWQIIWWGENRGLGRSPWSREYLSIYDGPAWRLGPIEIRRFITPPRRRT